MSLSPLPPDPKAPSLPVGVCPDALLKGIIAGLQSGELVRITHWRAVWLEVEPERRAAMLADCVVGIQVGPFELVRARLRDVVGGEWHEIKTVKVGHPKSAIYLFYSMGTLNLPFDLREHVSIELKLSDGSQIDRRHFEESEHGPA